jgi:hypothetical protein
LPKAAYTGGKEGQRERHEQSGYGNWRQRVITNIDDVIAASKPKESGVPKPGAGGMPGGADMGTCMKLEILSIPLSIFLYEPKFACKKSPDESFVMKGIDLPLA